MPASSLTIDGRSYAIHRLDTAGDPTRLPYTLRILLENALRAGSDAGVAALLADVIRAVPASERKTVNHSVRLLAQAAAAVLAKDKLK